MTAVKPRNLQDIPRPARHNPGIGIIADFMQSGTDTPLYIQAPWGLARVIGVIAKQPRPQVIALTDDGESVFLWALWTTQLQMEN